MLNITLFSQIISKLDKSRFKKLVAFHQSDKHQKGFSSWSHIVSMLFCQFANSQSVRDISNGLCSATGNLNHLGMQRAPSKLLSTLYLKGCGYLCFTTQISATLYFDPKKV